MNINYCFVKTFFEENERYATLPFVTAMLMEALLTAWENDYELDEQNTRCIHLETQTLSELCEVSAATINKLVGKLSHLSVLRRIRQRGKCSMLYLTISDDFRERLISARMSVSVDGGVPQPKEWELSIRGYGDVMASITNINLQTSDKN